MKSRVSVAESGPFAATWFQAAKSCSGGSATMRGGRASRARPVIGTSRRFISLLPQPPLGREVLGQQRAAFLGEHAGDEAGLVIEPRVGRDLVERLAGAGLRVGRPVHKQRQLG